MCFVLSFLCYLEEERVNYGGQEKRLDVESANIYGQREFLKACKDMGIVEDL